MTSMNERDSSRNYSAIHQIRNRKISVSMVTMYLYCPVAAYLRYVEHQTPQLTLKTILGRIVHAAATAFYEAEKQLISSIDTHNTTEAIARQGCNVISKAALHAMKTPLFTSPNYVIGTCPSVTYKASLNRAAIAKQGISLLQYFIHRWAERVKRFSTLLGLTGVSLADYLVSCHRKTEVFLESPALGIPSTRVDVLEGLTPLEIKTGRPPPTGVWPNDAAQVTLYVMILEQKTDTTISSAKVSYIVFDEIRTIAVTPELRRNTLQLIEKVRTMIFGALSYTHETETGIPPRNHTNSTKCAACSLRRVCPTPLT